eukprot:1106266-Prorocentrum_minimum.AAC.1
MVASAPDTFNYAPPQPPPQPTQPTHHHQHSSARQHTENKHTHESGHLPALYCSAPLDSFSRVGMRARCIEPEEPPTPSKVRRNRSRSSAGRSRVARCLYCGFAETFTNVLKRRGFYSANDARCAEYVVNSMLL